MASEPARKRARATKQQVDVLRRPAAATSSRAVASLEADAGPTPASASSTRASAVRQGAGAVSAPVATPARKSPKPGTAAAKLLGATPAEATASAPVSLAPVSPSRPSTASAAPVGTSEVASHATAAPASVPVAANSCAPSHRGSTSAASPEKLLAGASSAAGSRASRPAAAGRTEPAGVDEKQTVKSEGLAFLRLSSDCSPSMSVEKLIYLDKDEVTFGRMPSNSVTLDSARVPQMISRVHGRLSRIREEGKPWVKWLLSDNKSMNGILVNGQPIGHEGCFLQQGNIITFGRKMTPPEFEFVFEEPGAAPPPAPTVAEPDPAVEAAFAEHAQRIAELQQELEAERERKIMESQQRAATRSSALDAEEIQSELQCSICQDWVVHACTIECSHTFCKACIETWLLQKKFECPVCRHAVTREPVRSRAIEAIVQRTVERGDPEEKEEYQNRVRAAEKQVKRVQKLHQDLERSVNEALKKGKAFFHIDSCWSRREKETFQRGIQDYTGDTRETYCRLTSLTVQWVHSADASKLNQALANLSLLEFASCPEPDIRKRLLMFLHYG